MDMERSTHAFNWSVIFDHSTLFSFPALVAPLNLENILSNDLMSSRANAFSSLVQFTALRAFSPQDEITSADIWFVVVRRQFAALNLRNREYSQLTQKYRKDNRVISGLAKRVKNRFVEWGLNQRIS